MPSSTGPFCSLPVSATSRTRERTRRTILPTAISRGRAAIRRLPTSRIRLISDCESSHSPLLTTCSKRWVVAIAHGREFLIRRHFSSISRCSMALSTDNSWCDLRNVASEGGCPHLRSALGILFDVVGWCWSILSSRLILLSCG